MNRVYLSLLFLLSLTANAGTVYQCRDAQGKVTISDIPCGADKSFEKLTAVETAKERQVKQEKKDSVPAPLRKMHCDAVVAEERTLDQQWLDARRFNNVEAEKRVVERRRTLGAMRNRHGC
jgi:hypothetical protein